MRTYKHTDAHKLHVPMHTYKPSYMHTYTLHDTTLHYIPCLAIISYPTSHTYMYVHIICMYLRIFIFCTCLYMSVHMCMHIYVYTYCLRIAKYVSYVPVLLHTPAPTLALTESHHHVYTSPGKRQPATEAEAEHRKGPKNYRYGRIPA